MEGDRGEIGISPAEIARKLGAPARRGRLAHRRAEVSRLRRARGDRPVRRRERLGGICVLGSCHVLVRLLVLGAVDGHNAADRDMGVRGVDRGVLAAAQARSRRGLGAI